MKSKALAALLGVFLSGAATQAMAADLPTIRIAQGQFGAGIGQLAYTIADRKGFFDREGVHTELVKINGANAPAFAQGYIPAIEHGGAADIASIPNAQFIQVKVNGSNGIAVAAENSNPVYSLIVGPDIKSYADLKGKELTLTAPWDAITLTTRKLMEKHGLKADDYTFKSIAGTEGRMDCLKAGQCSAVILGQPADLEAIKMGYRRLGLTSEIGPVIYNVDVVTRDWAAANKDTLVRYLRADADAMRFIHDPKNRAEVTAILAELTKEPPDVVKEMMGNIENPKLKTLTRNAELDIAGFKHVLDLVKEFNLTDKPLPPIDQLVDLSYAKAAGIR